MNMYQKEKVVVGGTKPNRFGQRDGKKSIYNLFCTEGREVDLLTEFSKEKQGIFRPRSQGGYFDQKKIFSGTFELRGYTVGIKSMVERQTSSPLITRVE